MATFLKGWRKDAVPVNIVCDQIWNLLRDMLWHVTVFLEEIDPPPRVHGNWPEVVTFAWLPSLPAGKNSYYVAVILHQ